jgi:hypothetical protein
MQASHNLNFLDEAFLSILLAVRALLGKGFDCILQSIFNLLHQINGCEVTLPYFLNGLKGLMKATLVEVEAQNLPPEFFILVG